MYGLAGALLFIMYRLGSEVARCPEQVARYSTSTFKSLECRKGFFGLSSGHKLSVELAWVRSTSSPKKAALNTAHPQGPTTTCLGRPKSHVHRSHSFWRPLIFLVGSIIYCKLQLGHDVHSNFGRPLSDKSALERCRQLENRSIIIHPSRCYLVSY
jgi:hypothetical protein